MSSKIGTPLTATPLDEARIALVSAHLGGGRTFVLNEERYASYAGYGISKQDLDRVLNILGERGEITFGIDLFGVSVRQAERQQ